MIATEESYPMPKPKTTVRRRYPRAEASQQRQIGMKETGAQQGDWSVYVGLESREIGHGATESSAWQSAADAVKAEEVARLAAEGQREVTGGLAPPSDEP
jgi:hypothetical protein